MAKIGKLPGRQREPQPAHTRFLPLQVFVGGLGTLGRPFEFNTDATDENARPTKLSTSCPHCGHGIIVDVIPNSVTIEAACGNCGAGQVQTPQPVLDPFCNPVATGLIQRSYLGALTFNAKELAVLPNTTAAERIKVRKTASAALEDEIAAIQSEVEPSLDVDELLGGVGEEIDIEE